MPSPWIVFGLGNPGARYAWSRHNVGFWVVDRLAKRWQAGFTDFEGLSRTAWASEVRSGDAIRVLAKPRTFMNRVGIAAAALCGEWQVEPARLLIVYDDVDLDLGRVRIRRSGGSGGHRGIGSVIDVLQSRDFPRVRLGIRGGHREEMDLADYVLRPFDGDEVGIAGAMADLGAEAVDSVLEVGVTEAMNRFSGRRAQEDAAS